MVKFLRHQFLGLLVFGSLVSSAHAGPMLGRGKEFRPKLISAGAVCASIVTYLMMSSKASLDPRNAEVVLTSPVEVDRPQVPSAPRPTFENELTLQARSKVLNLFIESNERMATAPNLDAEEIQGDWIRDLVFSKPIDFADFSDHVSGNIFVEQFLDALRDRDQTRIDFFLEVLRFREDWSPLDFFSSFEYTVSEPGLRRWEATIHLPNTEQPWRISYEEISGPLIDPESKEVTFRIYR